MDTCETGLADRAEKGFVSRELVRVSDEIRTRDRRDHNPELYQLSYAHRGVVQGTSGQRRNSGSSVGVQAHAAPRSRLSPNRSSISCRVE